MGSRFKLGHFSKKKLSKMFQKFGQNFDPSKPSKSKDRAVLSWGIFQKKIVENVSKIWSNFDPSKPSKSEDTAVLSLGIFQKKIVKNVVKTLTPLNPLNQKIQPF